ncbi:mRNA export factor GLE1 [Brienomyrus brachyistius]|uniref:mRNA export factor GLE1 n=1 Tax=Brienomyrus brachyistius TaxID=42636 RepID=UPI0020B1CDB9|nr:mRNA export factor GLE1 [Brienomyrus brachyistius]
MPAESLRWSTLEALKNSPKGRLKYSPDWLDKGEDILSGCSMPPSLPAISGLILTRLSPQSLQKPCSLGSPQHVRSPGISAGAPTSVSSPTSPRLSAASPLSPLARLLRPPSNAEEEEEREASDGEPEVSPVASPTPPPAISLLSPQLTHMAGGIRICEEQHRAKAKAELRQRQELQEKLVAAVASRELEQLKRYEELMELKQRQEYQSMRDMMEKEAQESIGRQEKLKEEQRHRTKILNLRLREVEQQRLREAELERQRLAEGRERLRALNAVQEEVLQLNQLLETSTPDQANHVLDMTSYSTRANQLCSQVSEVVRTTAEGNFPSVEDMIVAERALQDMRLLIRAMQEEAAQARERRRQEEEEEARRKQAELQAKQEEQKKSAERSAKEKIRKQGLQTKAEDSTLKWHQQLQDFADKCALSFDELNNTKDLQTKKLKMELQKAATIPVSQISSISGSKLKEIFDKIDKLLSGRPVQSGGKSVSASHHPSGLDFVSYKLAEKFVKQGEEEVASHHEAAFPIAVVAIGLWELHPKVGDLILAHLHRKCPYSVPHYPPMKDGTSVEEYQRILGYRVEDSGVEVQDSFLKRMSGMIRLYAAVIQLRWPHGNKQGESPHGLNHGWRWLAQMLNMEPLADVTATLLFDFLEVCGHALMKQYQGQFWKLIFLIKDDYFPRIEAVTSSGQMGSVMRLKQFLENALRRREIPPAKGQLSPYFWRS